MNLLRKYMPKLNNQSTKKLKTGLLCSVFLVDLEQVVKVFNFLKNP